MSSEYIIRSTRDRMQWWETGFLYFFTFLSYYGYKYTEFNLTLIKGIYFVVIPLIAISVYRVFFIKKKDNPFWGIMCLITLSILLSIMMSTLFWGQSILQGYRASAPLLAIIFYFYLLRVRPSLKRVEAYVWILAGVYILLWLYGMSQAPIILFGDLEDADFSRGIFRLNIPGKAIIVLAFFLAINKYGYTQKKKFILLAALLFIFIVLQVTRQIIFFSLLIGLYYLLRKSKRIWMYLALSGGLLLVIANIEIPKDSVVGQLFVITENQIDSQKRGEDNIRLQEYEFFFSKFSKNIVTDIFGNGMPHYDSKYGAYYVKTVQESYRFYLSDVGYAQMFALTGWVGLFLYLLLFLRAIRLKVPEPIKFAQLFIIYQAFANIAASWYSHDVICICICIYLLSINYEKGKLKVS